MTPEAWNGLSEEAKEAFRAGLRQGRQARSGPQRPRDWAKDVWVARDQYRVENFLLGCGLLIAVPVVMGVAVAVRPLIQWLLGH